MKYVVAGFLVTAAFTTGGLYLLEVSQPGRGGLRMAMIYGCISTSALAAAVLVMWLWH